MNPVIAAADYPIGQIVHHKLFDYRGVVCDVDPVFMLPDTWYERVASSRPPKNEPWYRVLVDDSDRSTYVAQRNLECSIDRSEINHPQIVQFFCAFEGGRYRLRHRN
ncbi:MAG: heat shock protein HspQ [Gammaproteobacteria bacterium]|nr:heat shock protein HspQ [Gammaproteobacteria bacterium]